MKKKEYLFSQFFIFTVVFFVCLIFFLKNGNLSDWYPLFLLIFGYFVVLFAIFKFKNKPRQ